MVFPPSASNVLPPPPTKGRPGSSSAGAALPTFRSRPTGTEVGKGIVDHSISALFANRELLQSVGRNPIVQNLGKNAMSMVVRQQSEQLKATISSAVGANNVKTAKEMRKDGGKTETISSVVCKVAAEKELEDIFGPSLTIQSPPIDYCPKPQLTSGFSTGGWTPPKTTSISDLAAKWPPVRPPPPKSQPSIPISSSSLYPSLLDVGSSSVFPPSSLSPPVNQPHGIVKYPLRPSTADELSCNPGDLVLLMREVSVDWISGRNAQTGQQGILPLSFLDIKIPLVPTSAENCRIDTCQALTLYGFDTGVHGDLNFSINEWVTVTARANQDWLRGEMSDGRRGIFPINFVRIDPTDLSRLPFEDTSKDQTKRFVKALYDYSGQVSGDLCFRAGDLIELLAEQSGSEWAMGKLGDRKGLVPLTFVKTVED